MPTYLTQLRGRFYCRFDYVDECGRRHSIRHLSPCPNDRDRSLVWAARHRLEVIDDMSRSGIPTGPTFGELAEAYAADAWERGVRWDKMRHRYAVLIGEWGRETPAERITGARVLNWRAELRRRRGLSARSVNAYVTLLKAIFNLAAAGGRIPSNPITGVRTIPERHELPVTWFTVDQVAAIIEAAAELQEAAPRQGLSRQPRVPIGDVVKVAYYTAARIGNVLALRWDHLDFERGLIIWAASEIKNQMRRSRPRPVIVPLVPPLLETLARRLAEREHRSLVFANPRTGRPFVDIRQRWRAACSLANRHLPEGRRLPPTAKIMNLRHSRATHLLTDGTRVKAVADLLGDNVRMVESRYIGYDVDAMIAAVMAAQAPISAAFQNGLCSRQKRVCRIRLSELVFSLAQVAEAGAMWVRNPCQRPPRRVSWSVGRVGRARAASEARSEPCSALARLGTSRWRCFRPGSARSTSHSWTP